MKIITSILLILAIIYYGFYAFASLYLFIIDYKRKMIEKDSYLLIIMSALCILVDALIVYFLLK